MKVSIVTVNLNGARFLEEALASVLVQDYRNLELIVIDGGSTDDSREIIAAAAARDDRLHYVSEGDAGIADAMNKGVRLATGEIVGFLHSDDRYPSTGILSAVVKAFQAQPGAFWLSGGLILINQRGKSFRTLSPRRYSWRRLLRANILFHPATFVRTEVLRAHPFDTGLRLAMDYDLWLRLGLRGAPLLLSQPLAAFRVHGESCSVQESDTAQAEEFAIRCRFLRTQGKSLLPCRLQYGIKRLLNRHIMHTLQRDSARG